MGDQATVSNRLAAGCACSLLLLIFFSLDPSAPFINDNQTKMDADKKADNNRLIRFWYFAGFSLARRQEKYKKKKATAII